MQSACQCAGRPPHCRKWPAEARRSAGRPPHCRKTGSERRLRSIAEASHGADRTTQNAASSRSNKVKRKLFFALAALSTVLTAVLALAPAGSRAASHREAPLIALDPTADITDFFFFRSYEPGKSDRAALIMNVIPAEEPSAGPYYYNFDPNVRYSFSIDNDADGEAEDVVFEVTFKNEIRGAIDALTLPLGYAALPPITK